MPLFLVALKKRRCSLDVLNVFLNFVCVVFLCLRSSLVLEQAPRIILNQWFHHVTKPDTTWVGANVGRSDSETETNQTESIRGQPEEAARLRD